MSLDGVKLELPDGRIFELKSEPTITHELQSEYLVSGFRQITTAVSQLFENNPDINSNFAGVFDGVGAGLRTIQVSVLEEVQSGHSWGNAASDATSRELADEFAQALTTQRIGSTNPIIFEGGEYSTSGKFTPLTVVPGQTEITAAFGDGESPAIVDVNINLFEALSTTDPGDGTARGE